MSVDFHVMIPARYQSSRLPGKLLMELEGSTILERVYRQAQRANPKSITIATDNSLVFEQASHFGADVVMTKETHQSGTERIAEVVSNRQFLPDDIIVNVQGDEPLIAPELIRQVAMSLAETSAPMATLCWPVESFEICQDPNVVKVVRDCFHYAMYFSRSVIPFYRDGSKNTEHILRHIGLYAYRAAFLLEVVHWPFSNLEVAESLEQLRVLSAGYKIKVDNACVAPLQDINTEEDLAKARRLLGVIGV